VLSCKFCFLVHIGTQLFTLPLLHDLLPHTLIHQGNSSLSINRTQDSHYSAGNRRHKPAGLVPLCLQHYSTGLLEACSWQTGPRTPGVCKLGSPVPLAVLQWALGSLLLSSRTQNSRCPQYFFSHNAAAAVAPGSPHPGTSRTHGLCSLVDTRRFKPSGFAALLPPSSSYSVPGAWHHMCK
jgi:hypothetical protein